ncbi:MAG: hypothetical protein GY725_25500 [bacterium]|nr:hypothetical protein [bacterium]
MQLRVLTLNVWGLPEPVSTDLAGRMRRIGEAFPRLDADVVALQEVWTQGAREQLAAAGQRAGYVHVWHRSAALGGSGLMLLSRLPLQNARFEPYSLAGLPQRVQHADYYGGKGFVQVEIVTPAGALRLFNTHLHARYSAPQAPDEYRGQRSAQAVELAAAVREIREPAIVVGDLNLSEGAPEYRILLGLSGLRDTAAELDSRRDTAGADDPTRAPGSSGGKRIDFVLARDGEQNGAAPVALRRVFDEDFEKRRQSPLYSDHCGLLADIEFGASSTPPPPPRDDALALAEKLLAQGEEQARLRRRTQRRVSGLGAGAALALWGTRKRLVLERRKLLRAGLLAAAGAAAGSSAVAATLAEIFVPAELSGFERVRTTLEKLRAGAQSA